MKATPKNISFILVLIMLLPVLTYCGKSRPHYGAAPHSQWFPAAKSMPATQRPYTIDGVTYYPIPSAKGFSEQGIASWYGPGFHSRATSNGEIYDMYKMTAAHKTLPMNTQLLVKNLENGAQTVVRINDRGPFIDGRIIDLSHRAAQTLGIIERGTARVKIIALDRTNPSLAEEKPAMPRRTAAKATTPAPVPTRASTRTSRPVSAPAAWQDYFIQIDSFEGQEEARRLQQRFAGYGHHANLYRDHDGTINVVLYVGNDAGKAQRECSKLVRLGYTKAKIISVAN
ncbi:MAG: septal ring lytic transglycosylase RlpA family protein [Desulfobulbaceae bacterium]|jgi:rare lipoprotein A|nr:septal ring lytic transglycosylase RlpA family protein [Desulfobulbaceae bacterium]